MDFGPFLRGLRKNRHLTLEVVSQRAGISRVTLNRWEKGTHQPRLTELEAVLGVLEAGPRQRRQALSLLDAPRARTLVREEVDRLAAQSDIGPMPRGGDLLRTMRYRRGLSQEVLAEQIGVSARTLHRWELSEVWPMMEQLHSLCFALGAQEEEIIALTMGCFSPDPPPPESRSQEGIRTRLEVLKSQEYLLPQAQEELGYLSLEVEAWPLALQRPDGQRLLADICSMYAVFLERSSRYTEAQRYAERALALFPDKARVSGWQVTAGTIAISSPIHRTRRPARKWEMDRLRFWLSEAQPWPNRVSWIYSKIFCSLYAEQDSEGALEVNELAIQAAERTENPLIIHSRQWGHAEVLIQQGRAEEALPWLASGVDDKPFYRVWRRILMTDAYLVLNQRSLAHDCLQEAYEDIHNHHLESWRKEADSLATLL